MRVKDLVKVPKNAASAPRCPEKIASLAALALASSLKPFKDGSRVTPQQQAAAQQQVYKSPETGWTQLKDRESEGNMTDVPYLPPGIFAPVGWYPGDPPIFTEE